MDTALAERHRASQLTVRAAAMRDTLTLWRAFDVADIEGSWAALSPGVEAVVQSYRTRSASVAGAYYQAQRVADGVDGAAPVRVAGRLDREGLRFSLAYYGTVIPKALVKHHRPDVKARAAVRLVGGVARHVQNGARDTIAESVQADPQAVAWVRIGSGEPCAFCAMLIGRGAVYKQSTASFDAHDKCACHARPVFDRADTDTDQAKRLRAVWNEHATGPDPLNAFRRAYERAA